MHDKEKVLTNLYGRKGYILAISIKNEEYKWFNQAHIVLLIFAALNSFGI